MSNEVIKVGNYHKSGHNASSIVDPQGIAPTVMENLGTVTAVIITPSPCGDSPLKRESAPIADTIFVTSRK